MRTITNAEFASHRLNETGVKKVQIVKQVFDELLNDLQFPLTAPENLSEESLLTLVPQGRYLSIVKTKLEEACMFAVKAVSCDPANQISTPAQAVREWGDAIVGAIKDSK